MFFSRVIVLALLLSSAAACAPRATKRSDGVVMPTAQERVSEAVEAPAETSEASEAQQELYGPKSSARKSLIVVLGPGLARGYAHVGALQALEEAKIPVSGIVGTEVGGLIAALYSSSASMNEFEWRLLQMKEQDFFRPRQGLSRWLGTGNNGKILDGFLEQVLGTKSFSSGRTPLRLVIKTPGRIPPFVVATEGDLKSAVRAAMAIPGLSEGADWQGLSGESAGIERAYPLAEARALGDAPILVIDVLDHKNPSVSKELSKELQSYIAALSGSPYQGGEGANWVVRPDLSGIGYLESDRRAELIFKGKKAVQAILTKIMQEMKAE